MIEAFAQSKRRPKVLVLMATRNGAPWIAEQVRSIAAQRGSFDVELAVCDDGSTDDTLRVLTQEAKAGGLPVIVVQSALPGGSAGRNFFRLIEAIDLAGIDFVAFADQDDIWNEGKLQRALQQLEVAGASAYSASVTAFWPGGKSKTLRQSPQMTYADYLFEGAGQGCTFVLTGDLMRLLKLDLRTHAHFVREIHYHDWTLYALTRSHGRVWCFDDWPCLRYRQHASNDTGARGMKAGAKKRLDLIRSGWYAHQIRLIASLCERIEPSRDAAPKKFLSTGREANPLMCRTQLAAFVALHGRRKWFDRAVLVWASLAGYLGPDELVGEQPARNQ